MKLAILFVDDEKNVLEGLKRSTRSMKAHWELAFADSGKAGLAELENHHYDVVVADLRMSEMDGAEFLERARLMKPALIRIILSGHTDVELAVRSAKSAHRFLTKPCAITELKNTINQAVEIRERLSNSNLHSLASALGSLPSLPKMYRELVDLLSDDKTDLKDIAYLISRDLSIGSSVLKIANSSYFGATNSIESVEKAVVMFGVEVIKNLVLSTEIFNEFNSLNGLDQFQKIWQESMAVSTLAGTIAPQLSKHNFVKDQAMTAAMLQNIGSVILLANEAQKHCLILGQAGDDIERLAELEMENYGFQQQELSSYILGLWGFSDPIVESVYYCRSYAGTSMLPHVCLTIANAFYQHILLEKPFPEEVMEKLNSLDLEFDTIKRTATGILVNEGLTK